MPLTTEAFILAVIIGTLAAIVYSLRVLVMLERRVANMEMHILKIANALVKEEKNIESQESRLLQALKRRRK